MESLLTLDLAGRLGFCKWKPGLAPKIGTFKLPDVIDDNFGKRLSTYRKWLVGVIEAEEVEHCVYEDNIMVPGRDNLRKLKLMISLTMITEEVCHSKNIGCSSVSIGEWRKHYLGSGKYSTEQAKEYAMNKAKTAGFNPQHHDAAEALGIMDYVADVWHIKKDWPDSNIFGGLLGKPRA